MADNLQIRVFDHTQSVYSGEVPGPFELGRQGDGVERLYSQRYIDRRRIDLGNGSWIEKENFWRVIVASKDEDNVSRDHAFIESVGPGRIRLENLSARVTIGLTDGTKVGPSASREVTLPATLTLGRKVIQIREHLVDDILYHRLPESVTQAGLAIAAHTPFSTLALSPQGDNIQIEEILRWLKDAMGVLQSAASSSDFFEKAARAVVETVGLDTGYVVLLKNEEWKVESAWSADGKLDPEARPSKQILSRVRTDRETLYHVPPTSQSDQSTLMGVSAVVASPIMVKGEVIGAIYGDRRRYRGPDQPPRIEKLDAMLVDVLAACVAAGIARMEGEREAVAARSQFEQFFTPELAHQIAARPELLDGQESEITLLFCDIRKFSSISARIGPEKTVRWIYDVMSQLSDCVLKHRGVLVDYIGDELMAMWGAPEEQPDHAELACRAAVDMLKILPEMNQKFLAELGEHMDVGIGINTGVARVGNTGSKHKFKYGPLGDTVNMASRVQGVTKYLKVRLLITEATHKRLGKEFRSRRIGKVQVVNKLSTFTARVPVIRCC